MKRNYETKAPLNIGQIEYFKSNSIFFAGQEKQAIKNGLKKFLPSFANVSHMSSLDVLDKDSPMAIQLQSLAIFDPVNVLFWIASHCAGEDGSLVEINGLLGGSH